MIGILGTMGIDCPIAHAGVAIKSHVITNLPMKTEINMDLKAMKYEVITEPVRQEERLVSFEVKPVTFVTYQPNPTESRKPLLMVEKQIKYPNAELIQVCKL